jgi:hypothetical protein
MGVECASCGQVIPPGQFRCGNCGAVQTRDTFDDYGGLTEVTANADPVRPAPAELDKRPIMALPAEDDDSGVREPLVPRGTFASEVPDRIPEGEEREARPSSDRETVLAKPAPRATSNGTTSAAANGAATNGTAINGTAINGTGARIKSVRPPAKPPYLASEILREDLTPSEPGRRHMNVVLQVAPALGALAVLTSGIDRAATWFALALLAGLFVLTRFEFGYHTMTLLVIGLGASGLAVCSSWRLYLGGGFDGPLLAATVTMLAGALLFRTWYRAAYTARVLVALALVLALTWATWTSHRELLALEFDWQSWLPALAWYVFGILCLLSLLAFMGGETTGGCDVWALGLSVWYGLFACVRFALEGTLGGGSYPENFQTLGLLEPALSAPTAVALAQLLSRIFGRVRRPVPHAP